MFDFIQDAGNYEARKLADKVWIKGIGISTAFTSDEGYETALLDDNGVHPVERYADSVDALKGHKKWIAKVKKGIKKVTKLGGFGGFVEDSEVTLVPRN